MNKSRESNNKTSLLVLTGLMTALVTIATMFLMVPVPFTGGYIHLGDSMIFISVLLLGWKRGGFAAGVGSMMADLFAGYANWAPWTLVIKLVMAIIMGLCIELARKNKRNLAGISIATAASWLGFNFVLGGIISSQALSNPQVLVDSAELGSLDALPAFISEVQSQIMIGALLIPLFLIIAAVYMKKKNNIRIPVYIIISMTFAGLWMVFAYYIAGGLLYANFAVSALSVPWNMIQFLLGFVIAMVIYSALMRTPAKKLFKISL
ncbi:ECF transporter S component [Proteocatella sphenisci]|uniref:ECF transporter S component n=1 Tax=Proteocatella sphenisci TaxID=181070 RepID=UPI0004AF7652|nr:ECF transporter S component [Proteocatella sphenisci]